MSTDLALLKKDTQSPEDLLGEIIIIKEARENIKQMLEMFKSKTNLLFKKTMQIELNQLSYKRKVVVLLTIETLRSTGWEIELLLGGNPVDKSKERESFDSDKVQDFTFQINMKVPKELEEKLF